ncbi:MAG: hypothetical protein M1834_008443 [Cirrosporium novae-zelandiae]|nr:MAG: hypothetical protein M1834_008443 [Cirrosporium novae-zelandiae]
MSFGYGVGDIIATTKLAKELYERFADAPDEFKAIRNEINSLWIILENAVEARSRQALTDQQKEKLHTITIGCCSVLTDLYKKLNGLRNIQDPKTLSDKSQAVWKRLKWDSKGVKDLRSRIISNITLLSAFNGSLISEISQETKDGVDRLNKCEDNQQYRTITNWLSPTDFSVQQNDILTRRQQGTGEWLLNSDEYRTWLDGKEQTLFCPGIPGAGKTMISSIVINDLHERFRDDVDIGIMYLYFSYKEYDGQSLLDLLANLLKQLVQRQPILPAEVTQLYQHHNDKKTHKSTNEILTLLRSIAKTYSRIFIVIDALDECENTHRGTREQLSSDISTLQTQANVQLFATSRFIPEIVNRFKESMSLEIRASEEDVRKYLDGQMSRFRPFVSRDPDLQNMIKTKIVKAVDGMFLLAQLHLNSLTSSITRKVIKTGLEKLPKGSEALGSAYDHVMERIEKQESCIKEFAIRILSWIVCAQRPLTVSELQYALAIEIGESKLDKDNIPEVEDMISACAGLVTVDQESDVIRLVHYTTQEYFERTRKSWISHPQTDIARTCLTYLLFEAFLSDPYISKEELIYSLESNIFLEYAAMYWGYHIRGPLDDSMEQLALSFLKDDSKVSCCYQIVYHKMDLELRDFKGSEDGTAAHLIAILELEQVMSILIKHGFRLDLESRNGQTPLMCAARLGHEVIVKLLLEHNADPNSKNNLGTTPLLYAAKNGHETIVKLLLEYNADPNSKDIDGGTPLLYAAKNRYKTIMKLLLEYNADPNSKDDFGTTPLLYAAKNGYKTIVKLLFEYKADPNFLDIDGGTPLSYAAGGGYKTIIKLLLEYNADPNSKDNFSTTPLLYAAENRYETIVKLLLEYNADPNSKNNFSTTPLLYAAENRYETIVKLLLEYNADPNFINDGDTPLLSAIERGHKEVADLLMAAGGKIPDELDTTDAEDDMEWEKSEVNPSH